MKDIAEYLGVSPSTVSRAVNNTGYVSQELRHRIEQAVRELDYQPNLLARGLRKQATNMVGLVVPDLMNPHYTGVAQTIEGLLADHDYRLILSVSKENPQSELFYLQALQKQRVAGIIISSVGKNDPYLGHLVRQGIPVVAHSREVKSPGVDNVLASDAEGALQVTRHLIHLGHRKIAIICGPQELSTGRERLRGYTEALTEAGISVQESLIKVGAFQRSFGAEAAAQLLDAPDKPTAIFAAGGELMTGLMKTFFERGVDIPGEVSVVGYDDPDWFSFWHPPITTVAMDVDFLSRKTVELLLRRMSAPKAVRRSVNVSVPISFVVRSSTAPPRTWS
jgi:LacI family transcriptional regulator